MNSWISPLAQEADEEVRALIEILYKTEHRLEELTAGEVDTVADRDGRTFLLRHAQEHLRHNEAAKQAAILNALPANIALLDTQGIIISVNDSWRRYANTNAIQNTGYGVGFDYLAICGGVLGEDASVAHQAADGIRSVLSGKLKSFSLEYPCHSPTEQRWFVMTATPLSDDHPSGTVVMHQDVTAQRQTNERLRNSELWFRQMAENIHDVFFLDDAIGDRMLYVSPAYEEIWGRSCESLYADRNSWREAIHPNDRASTYEKYNEGMSTGKVELEYRIVRQDGSIRWIVARVFPVRDDANKIVLIAGVATDITERKQAEAKATQLLSVLEASLNEIYIFDADTLRFDYVNECARRNLGYPMDAIRRLTPLDFKPNLTKTAFLELIGPLLRHEIPKIIFETVHLRINGSTYPVEVHLQLVERGGKAVFLAVVNDITHRQLAEQALQTSMEEFRTLADVVPQMVWITRPDGWNIYFNYRWMEYTGLTLEESLGHGWLRPFHPDDQQSAGDAWQVATKTHGMYSVESRLRRADGVYRWWLIRGMPQLDASGIVLKWFGTCTDIHDLKMAELEIYRANRALRESDRRFSDLLENVELISVMLDRDARITYCNEYLLHLSGRRHEDVIGRNWFEIFVPPEITYLKDEFFAALLANQPEARHHENEILTCSGKRRLILWNNSVLRSETGEVIGVASIGEDITERKEAAHRIAYLNRVYAMLSGINTLIVRVRDRDELFSDACRVAVEEGGFRMAMIGIVDRSTTQISPVAMAGKDEELMIAIKSILSGELASNTMVARAIREIITIVSNDSQNDPQVLFGKKYAELGVHSMVILPLIVSNEAIGALALYASEPEFFQEEELKLLVDLAGDIAFGIDYIDKHERLNYLAYYDVLTGLANRSLFLERVSQYMSSAASSGHKLALLLVDLERFKSINDSLGRPAGDALLMQVAEWLTLNAGDVNLLARVGADQFAIVLPKAAQDGDLVRILEKTVDAFLNHPFHLNDAVFRIAGKVGVALFPDDGTSADTLFKNAEAALKKAKASGDRYLFYTQKMTDTVAGKLTLENQLRQALDKEEFVLHYQPKINLVSGKLTSAEALIRWNDPRMGLVPPDRFIHILEETGLIRDVGRWALNKAINDYLRWCSAGLAAVRIAVNVSPVQLRNRGFIDEIKQVVGIDARATAGLELEITESLIMADVKHSIASLQAIRSMGVRIAIDDFGTGFSSLSYLSRLPVDTLKIDRSFVIDMTAGPEGLALVATIINLAHSMKLKVVAEGVETEEQSRLLRLLDCDEMQGYLFSKPVPSDIFESRFLTTKGAE